MAKQADILTTDYLFLGEDKTLAFDIVDGNGNELDVSTFQMEWVLRRNVNDDHIKISKTTTGGDISVTTGQSLQSRVLVSLIDDDTSGFLPGTYQHVLRRTDGGVEAVLSFGRAILQKAAAV